MYLLRKIKKFTLRCQWKVLKDQYQGKWNFKGHRVRKKGPRPQTPIYLIPLTFCSISCYTVYVCNLHISFLDCTFLQWPFFFFRGADITWGGGGGGRGAGGTESIGDIGGIIQLGVTGESLTIDGGLGGRGGPPGKRKLTN